MEKPTQTLTKIEQEVQQKYAWIITGFKGGVGKSLFACALLEYLLWKSLVSFLLEFDTVNPDLRRKYHRRITTKLGVFSDDPNKENAANVLPNTTMEGNLLANMPAQIFTEFKNWNNNNAIPDICREFNLVFVNMHISDGNKDSLNIFIRSVEAFPDMRHVFVKNWGMRSNEWSDFDAHAVVQQYIAERNIPVLDFPKFHGVSTLQKIDRLDLSFTEALTHKDLDAIERSRVKQFLSKSYTVFEASGLF